MRTFYVFMSQKGEEYGVIESGSVDFGVYLITQKVLSSWGGGYL